MKTISTTHILFFVFLLSASGLVAQVNNTAWGTGTNNNGSFNATYGYNAGHLNTANANAFIGAYSGSSNTTGYMNSFLGYYSGNVNTIGYSNSFLGSQSGYNNITGNNNTFLGGYCGYFNTSGNLNTFIGASSGYSNSSGGSNTGVGSYALSSNKTGINNTIVGSYSGNNTLGSANVFLGYQAGYNETGSNKLYIANSSNGTPLISGDFSAKQVGINALPGNYTLNVGGTINTTAVYVNGVNISGNAYWTKVGNTIYTTGLNMAIGTTLANNPNNYLFAVNGKIGAKEVQIENTSTTWPDFVFNENYELKPLRDLDQYIRLNRHLPDVPSEKQVSEEGIKVYEMNAKLLQKIEELTLYLIQADKRIDALNEEIKNLQSKEH